MERAKPAGYLHTGLDRYEVFDFQEDKLEGLRAFISGKYLPFSFHVPFFRPLFFPYIGVATFFLNDDLDKRALSFRLIKSTMSYAKEWEADFVVTHLTWKDDSGNREKVMDLACKTQLKFSELADRFNMPVNIEFGGYSGHFHEPAQFVEFVKDHPLLGLCVDIGHTRIIAEIRNRDFFKDIEIMAPYTKSIHVWNTKGLAHCKEHNHVPVHPSQKTGDGWVDIEKTLEILLSHNKNCDIVFEYNKTYYDNIPCEVKEGMEWVRGIVDGAV